MRGTLHLVCCRVIGATYLTCASLKKASAAKRSCSIDRGNTVLMICADKKHPNSVSSVSPWAQYQQMPLMRQRICLSFLRTACPGMDVANLQQKRLFA